MRKIAAAITGFVIAAAGTTTATALPVAPEPAPAIAGIPQPCTSFHPFPDDASIAEIREQFEARFDFRVEGKQWDEEYRPSIKIVWETLDAVGCTTYRQVLQKKQPNTVGLNAANIRGYAWGDWSLTKPGSVTLDLEKFKGALEADDEGRLVRLVIHELAHVYNSDRFQNPDYWVDFVALHKKQGRFSEYAGRSVTETWADVVGYYVGRCALDNPYNTGQHDAYYDFVKTRVFGGKEFGPAPGEALDCSVPSPGAEEPKPGTHFAQVPNWIEDLTAE